MVGRRVSFGVARITYARVVWKVPKLWRGYALCCNFRVIANGSGVHTERMEKENRVYRFVTAARRPKIRIENVANGKHHREQCAHAPFKGRTDIQARHSRSNAFLQNISCIYLPRIELFVFKCTSRIVFGTEREGSRVRGFAYQFSYAIPNNITEQIKT